MEFAQSWHQVADAIRKVMIKGYLLNLLLLLAALPAVAQGVVQGVVMEKASKVRLPGVTILVQGTTIGTSTDTQGAFVLEVPKDTVILEVSFIGYQRRQIEVIAGDTLLVALKESCNIDDLLWPYVAIGASSNMRYAPLGGFIKVECYGPHFWYFHPVYRLEATRTWGKGNQTSEYTVALDHLFQTCGSPAFGLAITQQAIELDDWRFSRRVLTVQSSGFGAPHWLPLPINFGLGKISQSKAPDMLMQNYIGGELSTNYRLHHAGIDYISTISIAWWQVCWQWRSQLSMDAKRLLATLTYEQIGNRYRSVNLQAGIKFNKPRKRTKE